MPSATLYRIAVIGSVISSVMGIWLLIAWPRSFEMVAYSQQPVEEPAAISVATPLSTETALQSTLSPTAQPQPSATPEPAATPQSEASSAPPPAPEPRRYIVQQGDVLVNIADRLGVPSDAIISANGLAHPELIRPGDELVIP